MDLDSGGITPLPSAIRSALGPTRAHFAVSPDGARIAFEGTADEVGPSGRLTHQLYIAGIDGTDLRPATDEPFRAATPSWSPDGMKVVYEGGRHLVPVPGDDTIAVLDLATGRSTTLFDGPGEVWLPSFSPDGETVIFTRRLQRHIDLWAVPANGGRAAIVRNDAAFGAYSPNGEVLAYRGTGSAIDWFGDLAWTIEPGIALAKVNADRAITPRAHSVDGPRGEGDRSLDSLDSWERTRPIWSPDGTRIAYVGRGGAIRVIDVATGSATTIGTGELPVWLDDEHLIVPDFEPGFPTPRNAPLVVGSGERDGWRWQLSSSPGGGCIAFTDDQGSEVGCIAGSIDDMIMGRPSQVFVRISRPPAPPLVALFGYAPDGPLRIHASPGGHRPATTFAAPDGVAPGCCYYVAWLRGWERPVLPRITAIGRGTDGHRSLLPVELPPWAIEPFTTVATVAGVDEWRIDIFKDERTGLVCIGEPLGPQTCGPAQDPVSGWSSEWSRFEINVTHKVMGLGASITAWGVFRDPVTEIRVRSKTMAPIHPRVFPLPEGLGDPYRVFIVRCTCESARILGIDASGHVVAWKRI